MMKRATIRASKTAREEQAMKLGFFTMPIHPLEKDWQLSLREDREAFLLADELGFTEAYVGEHVTDKAENITSCVAFLAWIAAATKQIKLGTGTINMPNTHPATVAASIAMLDHMLDGRLIFGISPGGLLSDAELFGNLDADRNAMFLESINQVLEIWASEPPYTISRANTGTSRAKDPDRDIGQGFIAAAGSGRIRRSWSRSRLFKRRDRGGRARLGSDFGQFPDAGLGEKPLAEIRRGLRAYAAGLPTPATGASPRACSSPRHRDGEGLRDRSGRPTSIITARCSPS